MQELRPVLPCNVFHQQLVHIARPHFPELEANSPLRMSAPLVELGHSSGQLKLSYLTQSGIVPSPVAFPAATQLRLKRAMDDPPLGPPSKWR